MFGCLEKFYFSVYQLDYYLPTFKCPTITADYLYGVYKGIFNCPKRNQILPGRAQCVKKISKVRLYEILLDLTKKKNLDYLGFDINKLPTKQYILDVIYVIEPTNSIFVLKTKNDRDNHQIDFPVEKFFYFLLKYCLSFIRLFKNRDMRIVAVYTYHFQTYKRTNFKRCTKQNKGRQNQKEKITQQMLVEESIKAEQKIKNLENDMQEIQNI